MPLAGELVSIACPYSLIVKHILTVSGWLMGPADLIQYVSAAHTRICYSSVSPLQEACAVGEWKALSRNTPYLHLD